MSQSNQQEVNVDDVLPSPSKVNDVFINDATTTETTTETTTTETTTTETNEKVKQKHNRFTITQYSKKNSVRSF